MRGKILIVKPIIILLLILFVIKSNAQSDTIKFMGLNFYKYDARYLSSGKKLIQEWAVGVNYDWDSTFLPNSYGRLGFNVEYDLHFAKSASQFEDGHRIGLNYSFYPKNYHRLFLTLQPRFWFTNYILSKKNSMSFLFFPEIAIGPAYNFKTQSMDFQWGVDLMGLRIKHFYFRPFIGHNSFLNRDTFDVSIKINYRIINKPW